ncbi:MAG: LacI family DNA-binding transcriptional regulator [Clostridia bacterium]|nr:LacI family DNA-binding transcriptional regulator [Clostridia bacterium]
MKYSLDKIAKELGISKSTVSLVLNGHAAERRISSELEKTVKDFCDKVGYVPNINAKRASSKYVKNIGFLINQNLLSTGHNPFSDQNTSEITGGIVAAATNEGFRVTIQFCNENTDESEILEWLRNREIDGLIYYAYSFDESWHKRFVHENRHVVGIGIEPAHEISTVNIDNVGIMKQMCNKIIESGRRSFVYFSGYADSYVSKQRLKGMKDALAENNIPFDEKNVVCANYSEEDAYKLAIEMNFGADAIVCANDDMAIGVIRALKEKGIRIPEQISVTGADNIRVGQYVYPSLTTIDNMNAVLGVCAFDELLKLIKGGRSDDVVVQSKIIERQSAILNL